MSAHRLESSQLISQHELDNLIAPELAIMQAYHKARRDCEAALGAEGVTRTDYGRLVMRWEIAVDAEVQT